MSAEDEARKPGSLLGTNLPETVDPNKAEKHDWNGWKPVAQAIGGGLTQIGMTMLGQGVAQSMDQYHREPGPDDPTVQGFSQLGASIAGVVKSRWQQQDAEQFTNIYSKPFAAKLQQLGNEYQQKEALILGSKEMTPEQKSTALTQLHDDLYNNQIIPTKTQFMDTIAKFGENNPYIAKMGQQMMTTMADQAEGMANQATASAKQMAEYKASIARADLSESTSEDVQQQDNKAPTLNEKILDRGGPAVKQSWDNMDPATQRIYVGKAGTNLVSRLLAAKQFARDKGYIIEWADPSIEPYLNAVEDANKPVPNKIQAGSPEAKAIEALKQQIAEGGDNVDPTLREQLTQAELKYGGAGTALSLDEMGAAALQKAAGPLPPLLAQLSNIYARNMWVEQQVKAWPSSKKYEKEFEPNGVLSEFSTKKFITGLYEGKSAIVHYSDPNRGTGQGTRGESLTGGGASDGIAPVPGAKSEKRRLVEVAVGKFVSTFDKVTEETARYILKWMGDDIASAQILTEDISSTIRPQLGKDLQRDINTIVEKYSGDKEDAGAVKDLKELTNAFLDSIPEDPRKDPSWRSGEAIAERHVNSLHIIDDMQERIEKLKLTQEEKLNLMGDFGAIREIFGVVKRPEKGSLMARPEEGSLINRGTNK